MQPLKNSAGSPSANPDILDLQHLAQYTLGDKTLEQELLHLFSLQLENQGVELDGCADQAEWNAAAHTLKGAARAIGAKEIADLAEAFEGLDWSDAQTRAEHLNRLGSATTRFEAELAKLK